MSIRRHTLYNLTGAVLPITVTLMTVPLYLDLIGEERYGILALAWLLLGYFGLFDLGLSRATAQRIATLREGSDRERAQVFWTALGLNSLFGLLGGLALVPLGYLFFGQYFDLSDGLRAEALAVVPWLAAAVPVATISAVLAGALQGRERFLALNVISVSGTVLFQVLPLATAWLLGPDLAWLLPAALFGRLITFVALFSQCRRHVPLGAPEGSRALLRPLFSFGGWVSVTALANPLLDAADRFLIGALAGAKAVAWYSVPHNLAYRAVVLPDSLMGALFPRLAAGDGGAELERLTSEAFRALVVVLTPVIIAGMLIMEPFLVWWLDAEFAAHGADVGHLIALGFWSNGLARVPFSRLQARSRPDIPAKCHLAEVLPYLGVLVLAIHWFGIVGAAAAWLLRVTVDCALLLWFSGYRPAPRLLLVPVALLAVTAGAVLGLSLYSPLRWGAGGMALLLAAVWGWRTAPPAVRNLVAGWRPRARRALKLGDAS